MMRPVTGGAVASSQFGLCGSGLLMSTHLGHFALRARLARGDPAGSGTASCPSTPGLLTSGGSGHLPLHAGQPGGAPVVGQTFLHAGFFGSNVNSSHAISASGTAASFGGSGISSFERIERDRPAGLLEVDGQLVRAGIAAADRVDADEVLALRVVDRRGADARASLRFLLVFFDCDDRRVPLVEHVERELEAGARRRPRAA